MSNPPISDTDIAIVGMAGRYPKAPTLAEFWRKLCAGEEFTTFYSDEEMRALGIPEASIQDPHYVQAGGHVETIEEFDAAFFGYNPREASFMDPQQRHFLECAWESLEDAGYDPARFEGSIGVFGGSAMDTYIVLNIASNPHLMTPANQLTIQVGNDNSYLTTRVSYKLNLQGPSHTIQSACSTSLVATHVACQSLLNWECDMALVGGVAVHATDRYGYWHMEGGMHSPDGHCRTFDAKGGGPVFNMGVGVVVLKRLAEALEDGDHIYAVVKGSAINNDGSVKVSYAAPSVVGQARVIAEALANANIEPETINYIEAHGTATPLGDPIEVEALVKAYRAQTDRKQFCGIGSVKSNLGHLDAAAGVTSLIKTSLMLQHKLIPPSLHFERPNPQIDFANSPFSVVTSLTPWDQQGATPRRAGVSSFGIGGTNAHAILEEAPSMEPSSEAHPVQLLVLSARTETALDRATSNLKEHLQQDPDLNLADVAYTLQVGRKAFNHRRALLCRDREEALAVLGGENPKGGVTGLYDGQERRVVFMFSGQGAQYPQMVREWYEAEPGFQAVIDECCEILQPHLGLDLRDLLLAEDDETAGVAEQLNQTQFTQPALFVTEYALARLWMDWGITPRAMIGHSIGEYVAACLAGVFSLEDALALVAARGKLMQGLPSGAMLAVPLSEGEVQPMMGPELSIAAVNEPARCVVSGPEGAIQALEAQLQAQGLEGRRLHTSHAFHSAMMEPILEPFMAEVRRVERHAPSIPFISNVTGSWISEEQATDPRYWATHLRQAVRFAAGVGELLREPNLIFLEVGPGNTLTTLTRRHPARGESHLTLASLRHPQEQTSNLEHLLGTLGRLWVAGVEIDWDAFHAHEWRHRVSLPTYPFERQRYWIEPGNPAAFAASQASDSLAKRPDLTDWFYLPSWKRSLPPVLTGTPEHGNASWLLFVDECGLGSKLAQQLTQAGEGVVTVTAGQAFAHHSATQYTINPQEPGDYDALLAALVESGQVSGTIVHLWSVTKEENAISLERAAALQQLGFYSLLYLTQALGRQGGEGKAQIRVISSNMQAVASEPALHPAKATLLGPCKVIPLEYDSIRCQSIDLLLPEPASRQEQHLLTTLLAELRAEPSDQVIAYRGYDRWVQNYEPVPLPEGMEEPSRLRPRGVYLVTGGLSGIGLELARYLARAVQARLVLVGRSEPGPEQRAQIREIESLGAEVLTLQADVTDLAGMQAVVAQSLARFGALHGVLHAAGVPGAGIVQLKTSEGAEAVLAPKVRGTLVLNAALKDVALDFVYLFSSITAIIGGLGQIDYCAANTFLDAFAQHNTRQGTFTVSINWDAWQKIGMAVKTESLRTVRSTTGYHPLPHPLLEQYRRESPEKGAFVTMFTPSRHWVLGEHRVVGQPTIPGATYPEVAYAAYTQHNGEGAVELRDLLFVTPFMVGEEEARELHVTLERAGDEWSFRVASPLASQGEGFGPLWQEHVLGRVAALDRATPPRQDVAALIGRCSAIDLKAITSSNKMAEFVDVGPRWDCIRAVYAGTHEGIALLELGEPFADDLRALALHPAMMDIATSFAIQSLGEGNYLPLSYRQVRIYGPLSGKVYCYVRVPEGDSTQKETVMIDVLIMDEHGTPLVDIEGFAVKRVAEGAMQRLYESAQQRATAPRPVADSPSDLGYAILPEEGVEVFQRILARNPLPQIIVSTRELEAVIESVKNFDPTTFLQAVSPATPGRAERYPRPNLAVPYVAPRTELEQRIADLWQSVLGIDQIGVHDNFFELGGDSLLGTQIMVKAKEAGLTVTPNQFFQHQTIAELAGLVDGTAEAGSAQEPALTSLLEEEHLLANLDDLSEEEMDALLARMSEEGKGE